MALAISASAGRVVESIIMAVPLAPTLALLAVWAMALRPGRRRHRT